MNCGGAQSAMFAALGATYVGGTAVAETVRGKDGECTSPPVTQPTPVVTSPITPRRLSAVAQIVRGEGAALASPPVTPPPPVRLHIPI